MVKFAEMLKSLRTQKGVTQKEVAEYLGISVAAYSLYETGQREPRFEILEELSLYFNVSLSVLITGGDTLHPIAARLDGDEYTEEELKEIQQYAEYVKSKRTPKKEPLITKVHKDTE